MEVEVRDVCRSCGGDGVFKTSTAQGSSEAPCTLCNGTGKVLRGVFELDVPSTAQFQQKFQEVANALQAIWNKVKDL